MSRDRKLKQVLMVAEKPNLAKVLSELLTGSAAHRTSGAGSLVSYEWDGEWPNTREPVHFKMTSTFGHLYGVQFDTPHQDWHSDPSELFSCSLDKLPLTPENRVVEQLRRFGTDVDYLVLWLDCDDEGENICFEVTNIVVPVMNPCNGGQKVFRAQFSALAERDVREAFLSLRKPNELLAISVDARRELDLRIGVAFTRLQTRYFKNKYGCDKLITDLVPYGPCQTPTLAFCVERHMKIRTFTGEAFWQVLASVDLPRNGGRARLQWARKRTFDVEDAENVADRLRAARQIRASDVRTVEKRKLRPNALNTVQLLRLASNRLKMSPAETMRHAETLYMQGIISYPRTETTQYPPSFDRMTTLNRISTSNCPVSHHAEKLLYSVPDSARRGTDNGDHPPIIPLCCPPPSFAQRDPQASQLFQLICSYFLASVASDCRYLEKRVTFELDAERFHLEGVEVIEAGYTDILTHLKVGAVKLPDVNKGAVLMVGECRVEEQVTEAPVHLSESDLIDLMETHGIGTDASIPSHIESIFKRKFAFLDEQRRIVPTPLGVSMIDAYNSLDEDLAKPEIRATLEKDLKLIAGGVVSKDKVVQHVIGIYKAKFEFLRNNLAVLDGFIAKHLTNGRNNTAERNSRPQNFQNRGENISRNYSGNRDDYNCKRQKFDDRRRDSVGELQSVPRSFSQAGVRSEGRPGAGNSRAGFLATPKIFNSGRNISLDKFPDNRRNEEERNRRFMGNNSRRMPAGIWTPAVDCRNQNADQSRNSASKPTSSSNNSSARNFFSNKNSTAPRSHIKFGEQPTSSTPIEDVDSGPPDSNQFNAPAKPSNPICQPVVLENQNKAVGNLTDPGSAINSSSPEKVSNIPAIVPPRPMIYDCRNIVPRNPSAYCSPSKFADLPPLKMASVDNQNFVHDLPVVVSTSNNSNLIHLPQHSEAVSQAVEMVQKAFQFETKSNSKSMPATNNSPRKDTLKVNAGNAEPVAGWPGPKPGPPKNTTSMDVVFGSAPLRRRPVATVAGTVQTVIKQEPGLEKPATANIETENFAEMDYGLVGTEAASATKPPVQEPSSAGKAPPASMAKNVRHQPYARSVDVWNSVRNNPKPFPEVELPTLPNFAIPPGFSVVGKNPVQLVYEYCSRSKIVAPEWILTGYQMTQYNAALKISGTEYGPCHATTKKAAQKVVAKVFLRSLGFEMPE